MKQILDINIICWFITGQIPYISQISLVNLSISIMQINTNFKPKLLEFKIN